MFRHLDLIFALNEVYSHDTTQLLTDYSVIKAYMSLVQCKFKLRGLFSANQGGIQCKLYEGPKSPSP